VYPIKRTEWSITLFLGLQCKVLAGVELEGGK